MSFTGLLRKKRVESLVFAAESELRRPKLKEGLKDQTVVKKNGATFKAVIVGEPVPEIKWLSTLQVIL